MGYDNFNSYYDPTLKRARAHELTRHGIPVIEGDICDHSGLLHQFERLQPTHLIHLAAQAGVRHALHAPHEYVRANIDGFLSILELCRQYPHVPLLYASSSSVYGRNEKVPFSIDDPTDHQANLYGVTKKTNELMASTYHHLFGLSVTGLRFFTVYGPWGRPDMAYFLFTQAILEKRPVTLFNQGEMARDFTYVDDIVSGIGAALDRSFPHALINLGNDRPTRVIDLVTYLEEALGRRAHIQFLPAPPGEVLTTHADIEESRRLLQFSPCVTLQEGIQKFVSWYLDYHRLS